MSGRDDGAVVLVVERRRTEVDEANIGALDPHVLLLLDTAMHNHQHHTALTIAGKACYQVSRSSRACDWTTRSHSNSNQLTEAER